MKHPVIAAPAARDLDEIVDHVALDNPVAAENVYRGVVRAAERLPEFPALGRAGRHPRTREPSVPGLPYLLVHAVGTKSVTILAAFHASRDLARALHERMAGGHPGG